MSEKVVLPVSMRRDLADRIDHWRSDGRELSMNAAIEQLLAYALKWAHPKSKKRTGPKSQWPDGRYMALHHAICSIQRERGVSVLEAAKHLCKRSPEWGKYRPATLKTKFFDGQNRLLAILRAVGI
jgi:hypothetical protein